MDKLLNKLIFHKKWKLAISSCAGGAEVLMLASLALFLTFTDPVSLPFWDLEGHPLSLQLEVHFVPHFVKAFSLKVTLCTFSFPRTSKQCLHQGTYHKSGFCNSLFLCLSFLQPLLP